MKFINLLKKIFIKSQFYVSFCATLLGVFIWKEQDIYQNTLLIVLFLTFWNGYIFTVFHKKKDAFLMNLVGFAVISFIILKFLNLEFFFKWLIVLLLGTLYNADFFNINIREFSLVKTFYVGFVWAMSLVWLPFGNNFNTAMHNISILSFIKASLCGFNIVWFFIIFLFISAITFPFEIRDLKRDHFPTLPKVIGIQNTKYLSYFFLLTSSILAIKFLQIDFAIAFSCTCFLAVILINLANEKRIDWYYSFILESLSTMPFLILILLKYFC